MDDPPPQGRRIVISVAETVDGALFEAVAGLVPQLSSSAPPPTLDQLRRIVEDPATTLLLATEVGAPPATGTDGRVVGMLTLAIFLVPTGLRAWIEDVVVDDVARGAGVASSLIRAAVAHAEQQGARTVDLTSRPQRVAANRLYVRLGFERRDTNVYRKTPEGAG